MRRTRSVLITLAALLLGLAVLGMAGCGSGGASATASARASDDLTNLRLGPDYSHWLLGPVARMATEEEIAAYQALTDDLAALEWVEAFWARRDPDPATPVNEARVAFEERVQVADRRFAEAGILGRRTPRGTIHVLYGAPETIEFEIPLEGGDPVHVWEYPEGAPAGLDGREPNRFYRFRKRGELTRPYAPGGRRSTLPSIRGQG